MGRGQRRAGRSDASAALRLVRRRVLTELIHSRSPISFARGQHQPLDDEPIGRYLLIGSFTDRSGATLSLHALPGAALEWMEEHEQWHAQSSVELEQDLEELDIDVALLASAEQSDLLWEIVDLDSGRRLEPADLQLVERRPRERASALAEPF